VGGGRHELSWRRLEGQPAQAGARQGKAAHPDNPNDFFLPFKSFRIRTLYHKTRPRIEMTMKRDLSMDVISVGFSFDHIKV
jgi:hypothetical protein